MPDKSVDKSAIWLLIFGYSVETESLEDNMLEVKSTVCYFLIAERPNNMQSVFQGRICLGNFTCRHTETEVADHICHLTQSHSILRLDQPIQALNLHRSVSGRVTTKIPFFQSLVWLVREVILESPALVVDTLLEDHWERQEQTDTRRAKYGSQMMDQYTDSKRSLDGCAWGPCHKTPSEDCVSAHSQRGTTRGSCECHVHTRHSYRLFVTPCQSMESPDAEGCLWRPCYSKTSPKAVCVSNTVATRHHRHQKAVCVATRHHRRTLSQQDTTVRLCVKILLQQSTTRRLYVQNTVATRHHRQVVCEDPVTAKHHQKAVCAEHCRNKTPPFGCVTRTCHRTAPPKGWVNIPSQHGIARTLCTPCHSFRHGNNQRCIHTNTR